MPLPKTYNPIIGNSTKETLFNARCSIYALQEIGQLALKHKKTRFSKDANIGLYYLLECISEAMRYEVEHKNK